VLVLGNAPWIGAGMGEQKVRVCVKINKHVATATPSSEHLIGIIEDDKDEEKKRKRGGGPMELAKKIPSNVMTQTAQSCADANEKDS
jgi:hypothetical protein